MPGFSVGGPIRRNNTFFFVNTQWLRAKQTRVTRTVLTATGGQGALALRERRQEHAGRRAGRLG
jgi:hypothetical protein